MTDELDLLAARPPNPAPADAVVERHRAQLHETMTGDGPAAGPRRRAALVVAAAAAAVVVLAVAIALGGSDAPSRVATTADEPATTTSPSIAPACGATPADIDVPNAVTGPVDGPFPGRDRAVVAGQVVMHWTTPTGSVEVRWPAAPRPAYDFSEPRDRAGLATFVTSPQRVELAVDATHVVVDTTRFAGPTTATCNVLDVEVVDGSHSGRTGVDVTSVDRLVDIRALVIASERVPSAPANARPCQSPRGVDRPPNVAGEGPSDAWSEASSADALARFLTTDDARGFAQSGYVELVDDAGGVTYGKPFDGGDGYVVLISTRRDDNGWSVEGWKAAGC